MSPLPRSGTTPRPTLRKHSWPRCSCLSVGIHANAVARGITLYKVELELEAGHQHYVGMGVGDLTSKPLGLTAVRAKVHIEGDASRGLA